MPLKEATIKARSRGRTALNIAVATIRETPLPVKLVIGGTIGTAAITVLFGCNTQSQPCEISPENLNPNSAARPITIVSCNPKTEVSAADQAQLKKNYGADLKGLYLWAAVDKGSETENVGDGTIAFSTYSFENGRSMVVFPSGEENYNSGENKIFEYSASWFETADGKILYSYNYRNELNPGKAISFFTIEYNKPEGVSLADLAANGADPSKILGNPSRITVSNPPANEIITYNVDSRNADDKKLIEQIASLFNPGPGVAQAKGLSPQELTAQVATPTIIAPTEAPTAVPTPVPVEVAPGEFVPASQIVGYEARDTSGKLIYVEDTHGNWIEASHEVLVPVATTEDWTNVNTRLGSDFIISTDGLITGVEGLNIDKANGEVTFNFDGKGPETYHIGNIKVQEINGVKTLLVAGYAWNGETESWEVFNPGFPMESPEAQLGWFMEADVANGNWLRWHQRAIEGVDMEALFPVDSRPDSWGLSEYIEKNKKGSITTHVDNLVWENSKIDPVDRDLNGIIKTQYPGRGALSFGYMTDANSVIISFEALNGDGSATSLPLIMDEALWTEQRDSYIFTAAALASGHEWDSSMTMVTFLNNEFNNIESWQIWPFVSVYPDATVLIFGQDAIVILKRPEGIARRKATIQGDEIKPAASLEIWGGGIQIIPHN